MPYYSHSHEGVSSFPPRSMIMNCDDPHEYEYAGAFFPRAQGIVIAGGTFISVTNVIHIDNTMALIPSTLSRTSAATTGDPRIDNLEFSSGPAPPGSTTYAGSFFPSAQGLIITGGTFISVTNIICDATRSPPPTTMDDDFHNDDEFASDPTLQLPECASRISLSHS
ncbi:hypothetical protein K438DRAFT_343498 [Mycena galopus ATCC 62051]|nr:hypothetical protein K438DRAFT_343498 [Mycena galopus ATCC 62051]